MSAAIFFYRIGKSSIRGAKEWPKAILWSGAVFNRRFSTFASGAKMECRPSTPDLSNPVGICRTIVLESLWQNMYN